MVDTRFHTSSGPLPLRALLASLVCGYLGETLGWKYGFEYTIKIDL